MESRPVGGQQTRRPGRVPGIHLIPLIALGIVLVIVPLSAVVALPGERQVKDLFGLGYTEGCVVRDRGDGAAWRREPPLPHVVDEAGTVRVGHYAYLVGGTVALLDAQQGIVRSTNEFGRYDLDSGRYERLPSLPVARNHMGVAAYRGDIYAIGGLGGKLVGAKADPRVWRYSMARRRWERLPDMPTARGALGVAVVGDRLYAVGGVSDDTALTTVEAYDFRTRRWYSRAPERTARDHLGVAALGGEVYAAGGRSSGFKNQASTERYDPRRNRWASLADHPSPVSGAPLVGVGDRVILAGGEDRRGGWVSGRVFAYNPRSDSWTSLESMRTPKHGDGAVVYRGRLYAFAGSECGGFKAKRSVTSMRLPG